MHNELLVLTQKMFGFGPVWNVPAKFSRVLFLFSQIVLSFPPLVSQSIHCISKSKHLKWPHMKNKVSLWVSCGAFQQKQCYPCAEAFTAWLVLGFLTHRRPSSPTSFHLSLCVICLTLSMTLSCTCTCRSTPRCTSRRWLLGLLLQAPSWHLAAFVLRSVVIVYTQEAVSDPWTCLKLSVWSVVSALLPLQNTTD